MSGSGNPASTTPPPRLDHMAVSLSGGKILIFGGFIVGFHSASQSYPQMLIFILCSLS